MNRRDFIAAAASSSTAAMAADATASKAGRQASAADRPASGRPKKWALVLGGGTARGFAHIGVLKVLQQNGLQPDLVVGCSAGALIGALFASGLSGRHLEALAMQVKDSEVADMVAGNKRGLVGGGALQAFVNKHVRDIPIEKLATPFACVATNLTRGLPVTFTAGDTGLAVRASSSIPAVFIPVQINGQEYVDGGLISPVPVGIARELGADVVVAVSLNAGPQPGNPSGMFELVMQSFEIMASSITRLELLDADATIKPELAQIAFTDFSSRNLMITLGEQAARRAIPEIKRQLRVA